MDDSKLCQLHVQNHCETFCVDKIKKFKVFSQLNASFTTSCKNLCTELCHATKIKTSLNIVLRAIEHII